MIRRGPEATGLLGGKVTMRISPLRALRRARVLVPALFVLTLIVSSAARAQTTVPADAAAPGAADALGPVKILDVKEINSGDTAWMLVSAGLVLMMTAPGLALFYGGLVRRKNVL